MSYSVDEINKLIGEYGLLDEKDYILNNIKKSIHLKIVEEDDYKTIGNSRVGGFPDAPKGFEWPHTYGEEPMTFIAQLNLKEISIYDEEGVIPKSGMLYFFMGIDEPAYDIEHKVIYIESDEGLELLKIAEPTVLDDIYEQFIPHRIVACSSIEIPNYAYMDYDAIKDEDAYFELKEELKGKDESYIGCMFGYPEGQHDDVEIEAALKILLNEPYGYSESEIDKIAAFYNGDEKKAQDEVKNIKMLLEITSDSDVGFQWWDCGEIHFFIRKEDLMNKNFDRTYLSLYSS